MFLKEQLSRADKICILTAFVGVFLVSFASFTGPVEDQFRETAGILMCLLAAVLMGGQYTIIRFINQHTSFLTKPFFFGAGGTVVCLLPLLGG